MIAMALALATTVGVSTLLAADDPVGQEVGALLTPHVDVVPVAASRLRLGMAAAEVTRIMGEAAKETNYLANGMEMRRLTFSAGPIASKVTLARGKVSAVVLDVFRTDNDDLPAFVGRAWPGMHSTAVRRALGDPAEIRQHLFFGIKLGQWVFRRRGQPDVSVFFVDDRVVARALGTSIPSDIFRVALPLPPDPTSEEPLQTPQAGMSESEVKALYGAVKLRVDYSFNRRSASRTIYETHAGGSFVSFTFVNGIVTQFEDLGRLPDDVFEGR
jgi:hypothetical protein